MSGFLERLLRGLNPATVTSFIMMLVLTGSSVLSKLNKAGDVVHYTPTLLTTEPPKTVSAIKKPASPVFKGLAGLLYI
jgi:hypothetical protein